jgi:nucleoside-diphosphate-sugar epimerase
MPASARLVRASLSSPADIVAQAAGASVVVHAVNPIYTRWDQEALPALEAGLQIAEQLGSHVMLPGNVYNFGEALPAVLTPSSPERGDHAKARIRIELESRMAASEGLDSVVIRAGDFFGGDGEGTWLDMALATRLAGGRFVYPGPMDAQHAWAYLPDLAQAFVRVAAQRAQIHGHRRLHFAGHSVDGHEMQRAMCEAVGRDLKLASFPWWLFRLAAPFKPVWREVLKMSYLWRRPHRLDDASLRAVIGPVASTPLVDALRAALAAQGLMPARPALQSASA